MSPVGPCQRERRSARARSAVSIGQPGRLRTQIVGYGSRQLGVVPVADLGERFAARGQVAIPAEVDGLVACAFLSVLTSEVGQPKKVIAAFPAHVTLF